MSKTIEREDITARIRERAYNFWEREGYPTGRDLDHWLAAEAEVQGKKTRAPRTTSKTKTTKKRSTKSSK